MWGECVVFTCDGDIRSRLLSGFELGNKGREAWEGLLAHLAEF